MPDWPLSENIEKKLVKYCLIMEEKYFGSRTSRIKLLATAYQLAVQNNKPYLFSNIAGEKWLNNFLKHHPILSFLKPGNLRHLLQLKVLQKNMVHFTTFWKNNQQKYSEILIKHLMLMKQKFLSFNITKQKLLVRNYFDDYI